MSCPTETAFHDDPVGISKATRRLKTIAINHGVTPGLEPLQKAFALIYEQNPVTQLSRLKEIIPYGSDAALIDDGTIHGGSALPRHSFQYSDAKRSSLWVRLLLRCELDDPPSPMWTATERTM